MATVAEPFWTGRRVLVTGNTGFKGSWLSLWMSYLGADVFGFSLGVPTQPSLFELADLGSTIGTHFGDVADLTALSEVVESVSPDTVVHLAAQSLVGRSHRDPVETYRSNVMGTVNLLEAIRRRPTAEVVLVVTSDKCYESAETAHPESDPLGGRDPYSSSKACSELVTAAYRESYFAHDQGPRVVSARAGNVIGGGDWSRDRLVPDAVRAVGSHEPLVLRNPSASRPWQHVLDCLSGYMLLIEAVAADRSLQGPWNFGPEAGDIRTVKWLAGALLDRFGVTVDISVVGAQDGPLETDHLALDSSRARSMLGWTSKLTIEEAVEMTTAWYLGIFAGEHARSLTESQIDDYTKRDVG